MHASENMLCQCLYTRNILPDQLLKRLLEVLEFSQIQELVGSRALGGGGAAIHRSGVFTGMFLCYFFK